MRPVEYVFRIDVFTPDTLPMSRLAEYLAALARMIGHAEHTHFVRVEEGSAQLVHKVDAVDAPKVEARLNNVRLGQAPKEALRAHREIDDLLANDNALGLLTEKESGRVVVPFVGRNRPKPLVFPAFREDTAIQGQIVSIGGRDSTAHAILQDGEILHVNISMTRDVARELAPLLYGAVVRLYGNGRFERQPDGNWKMLDFKVDRYSKLDESLPKDILPAIRGIAGNRLMSPEAYWNMREIREGGEDDEEGGLG
jgi:hypothetical protein